MTMLTQMERNNIQLENNLRLDLLEMHKELIITFSLNEMEIKLPHQLSEYERPIIVKKDINNMENFIDNTKKEVGIYLNKVAVSKKQSDIRENIGTIIHNIDFRLKVHFLSDGILIKLPIIGIPSCKIPNEEKENIEYITDQIYQYLRSEKIALHDYNLKIMRGESSDLLKENPEIIQMREDGWDI